jgi:hypothetical protein
MWVSELGDNMAFSSWIRSFAFAVLLAGSCWGQAGFSVSSGSAAPGGAVTLNLSFTGNGSQAASLQWTLAYPSSSIAGVNITATSVLTGAGKNVNCVAGTGTYTCVASGTASAVPDGVIASAQFTLSSAASNSNVTVSNARAASTSGSAVTVSASGGSISVTSPPVTSTATLSSLSCAGTSLTANGSTTCTAALSGAAPSGGLSVLLSDDNSWLSIPGYVTVPAGAASATFTANAGSVPSGSSGICTITATLVGVSRTASIVLGSSSQSTIRMRAGGGAYTTSAGVAWSADANYSGGNTWSTSANATGTTDPALYQTQRWGAFTYQFAVPSGTYTVNLKFAEEYMTGAGQRVFNVAINGSQVLSNFDVVAQAGGAMKALDKSFPVNVTSGQVSIAFTAGSANWPMVNAIEIVPGVVTPPTTPPSSSFNPVRVNVGGAALTDAAGALWAGDSGASGGSTWSTTANCTGTNTPALYRSHRWGVFSYQYAVPSGSYTVNLKFAEPVMNGAGQRVFNAAINGSQVLTNFDIFAQAGGAMKALDKSFPVTVTNGQINIAFTAGSANWPMVNAIEIVSATGAPATGPSLVRVNTGGDAYTDPSGAAWTADTGYSGGNTWSTSLNASGTTTPTLYQTQRYGVFSYQFAVPSGSYTVKLKFAELFWASTGQRVFNVAINGSQVLSNFDIVAQAGGSMKALDKSFPVTVTNGQINIAFTAGSVDWPMVNAIEIAAQ